MCQMLRRVPSPTPSPRSASRASTAPSHWTTRCTSAGTVRSLTPTSAAISLSLAPSSSARATSRVRSPRGRATGAHRPARRCPTPRGRSAWPAPPARGRGSTRRSRRRGSVGACEECHRVHDEERTGDRTDPGTGPTRIGSSTHPCKGERSRARRGTTSRRSVPWARLRALRRLPRRTWCTDRMRWGFHTRRCGVAVKRARYSRAESRGPTSSIRESSARISASTWVR